MQSLLQVATFAKHTLKIKLTVVMKSGGEHKHFHLIVISLFLFFTIAFVGCKDDNTIDLNDCVLNAPSYNNEVKKIVDSYCSGSTCHTNNIETFDFTTYEGLKVATGSIYNRITRNSSDPLSMPKGFQMQPCDLEKLKVWINAGAPRN
jgi:hypothetical protein